MHWSDAALVVYLTLVAVTLGAILATHGQTKEVKYNFWLSLVVKSLVAALMIYFWWN